MNNLIEWLKLYKDSVYSIGIILTFAISSLSAYLTFKNNKAIHYVNSITKSRVDWMNHLRNTIGQLNTKVQIYLKHEWNRVKYESQGKIYEKEVQQFDYEELEKQYNDKQYKERKIKRMYIQIKCKLKKILFLPATYIIGILLLALFLIA